MLKKRSVGILTILVGFIACADKAYAQWDLSASYGARLGPFGLAGSVDGGYNHMLWGERGGEGLEKAMYGYVRPAIHYSSSLIINRIEGKIEVFPISILKLAMGGSLTHRDTDIYSLDCQRLECRRPAERRFMKIELKAGYDKYFALLGYEVEFIDVLGGSVRPIGDEIMNLEADRDGDKLQNVNILVGTTHLEPFQVGLFRYKSEYWETKTFSDLYGFFFNRKMEDFSYGGYVGSYRTSTFYFPLSVGIKVTHILQEGIGI